MKKINSSLNSAIRYAELIKSKVCYLTRFVPENDQFNICIRLMDCVSDLNDNIINGYKESSKIEKVRSYTKIVGNLLMCKDYLEYLNNIPKTDIEMTKSNIKNLSNLLSKSFIN